MRVIGDCMEMESVVASVADLMGCWTLEEEPAATDKKEAAKPRGHASGV